MADANNSTVFDENKHLTAKTNGAAGTARCDGFHADFKRNGGYVSNSMTCNNSILVSRERFQDKHPAGNETYKPGENTASGLPTATTALSSGKMRLSGSDPTQLRRGLQDLRLETADTMFGPFESGSESRSPDVTHLCSAMTHLATQDFADHVIKICNRVTSLALNEIDSLCTGLQRTSLDGEFSIGNAVSVLCLQIRQMQTSDLPSVIDDLSCKLQDIHFHDYNYNTFISINQLLTRLSACFLADQLDEEFAQLRIKDQSFEDQYELTCRMIRYILTTSPPDGRVLTNYMQQLHVFNSGEYF